MEGRVRTYTTAEVSDALGGVEISEQGNVSQVLTAVAEGSCEVGTTYYSDTYGYEDQIDVLETAQPDLTGNVIYPVCQVVNDEATDSQKAAAADFPYPLSPPIPQRQFLIPTILTPTFSKDTIVTDRRRVMQDILPDSGKAGLDPLYISIKTGIVATLYFLFSGIFAALPLLSAEGIRQGQGSHRREFLPCLGPAAHSCRITPA